MATIGTLLINLKVRTASFDRGMKHSRSTLIQFGRAMDTIERKAVGLSRGIVRAGKWAAVGIAGIGAATLTTVVGFEKSMSRVKALTNATGKDFDRLSQTAKDLGETTQFTARQAAEAMGFLGLAGFKTNQIIEAMPATLNLASAGQLDMAQSANITAKIMAGMGIASSDVAQATDVLAKAFTTANTDLVQLGDALKYVGPVGKTAGKELTELVAAIQVMSNAGIQAAMAGTSLRNIITRLSGGIPVAAKGLKQLGIIIKDNRGGMLPLANIIDQLHNSLSRLGEAEKTAVLMRIFGQRAGPAMAALIDQGGAALRRYEVALRDSTGTGARIAAEQLNNTAGSFVKFKSVLDRVLLDVGNVYNREIRSLLDNLKERVKSSKQGILDWVNSTKMKIIDWAEKVGGLDGILDRIVSAIQSVGTVAKWAFGIVVATVAVKAIGTMIVAGKGLVVILNSMKAAYLAVAAAQSIMQFKSILGIASAATMSTKLLAMVPAAAAITAGLAALAAAAFLVWKSFKKVEQLNALGEKAGIDVKQQMGPNAGFLDKLGAASRIEDTLDMTKKVRQRFDALQKEKEKREQITDQIKSASNSQTSMASETQNAINKQISSLENLNGTMSDSTKGMEDMAKAAKRVFEQTLTPLENYEKKLGGLSKLLESGLIEWETYGRAVRMARDSLESSAPQAKMGNLSTGSTGGGINSAITIAAARPTGDMSGREKFERDLLRIQNESNKRLAEIAKNSKRKVGEI